MADTLEPQTYRRVRKNLFRVHYQFVFANTLPTTYDFMDICFSPRPLFWRSRHRHLAFQQIKTEARRSLGERQETPHDD